MSHLTYVRQCDCYSVVFVTANGHLRFFNWFDLHWRKARGRVNSSSSSRVCVNIRPHRRARATVVNHSQPPRHFHTQNTQNIRRHPGVLPIYRVNHDDMFCYCCKNSFLYFVQSIQPPVRIAPFRSVARRQRSAKICCHPYNCNVGGESTEYDFVWKYWVEEQTVRMLFLSHCL